MNNKVIQEGKFKIKRIGVRWGGDIEVTFSGLKESENEKLIRVIIPEDKFEKFKGLELEGKIIKKISNYYLE